MNSGSCFVTGTDTGVGKTVVAAALLNYFRSQGRNVVPMKPVQTGDVSDLDFCLRAAGVQATDTQRKKMGPYHFPFAASPHLAARAAHDAISLDYIRHAFEELRAGHDGVIVEGAGGVLTPLGPQLTMLGVMSALMLPVLVVARPGLGTLNHTLLTVHELERAKLPIQGIILNESSSGSWNEIEEDNLQTLREKAGVPVARFRYVPGLEKDLSTLKRPDCTLTFDTVFQSGKF